MFVAIPTIVAIVAALDQATKWFANTLLKKNVNKYIPLFSVVYGLLAGLICIWQFNDVFPEGTTWVQAIILGIVSGASSTGFHQAEKQLTRKTTSSDEETVDVDSVDNIEPIVDEDTIEETQDYNV